MLAPRVALEPKHHTMYTELALVCMRDPFSLDCGLGLALPPVSHYLA